MSLKNVYKFLLINIILYYFLFKNKKRTEPVIRFGSDSSLHLLWILTGILKIWFLDHVYGSDSVQTVMLLVCQFATNRIRSSYSILSPGFSSTQLSPSSLSITIAAPSPDQRRLGSSPAIYAAIFVPVSLLCFLVSPHLSIFIYPLLFLPLPPSHPPIAAGNLIS